MGGIDVLTFTAGVGEKGPISRKAICEQLEFLGVKIDDEKNKIRGEEAEISTADSKVKIYVVPTNEELMIARETLKLIK
jgi:acetate kinase